MLVLHPKKILLFSGFVSLFLVSGAFFISFTLKDSAPETSKDVATYYSEAPQDRVCSMPISSVFGNKPSIPDLHIPILVYHIVRPSYPTDSAAVKGLAQTPAVFEAQMQYLADAGYQVISYEALETYLQTGTALPKNAIVITFDDGWGDQFKYAFPILQAHKYTATFFVFTNPIGTRGFMTWDELRALRDAGMTIGSHTRSHPFLNKITDPAKLWNEIEGSKTKLEKELSLTVTLFAYPFGKYNATSTDMVKKAGYTSARGDYLNKNDPQTMAQIYDLGALNAPTSIEGFKRRFPPTK